MERSSCKESRGVGWQNLCVREGVDVFTISSFDECFIGIVRNFLKTKEMKFFSLFQDKFFTHYVAQNPQEIGMNVFWKNYSKPEQIIKRYEESKEFLKEIEKTTSFWKKSISPKNFLEAYEEFRKQFTRIHWEYSIHPWFAIESWQTEFEKMITGMIKRNKLEKETDAILDSVYSPWKKTAIIRLREEILKGVPEEKLAEKYQFIRSWSAMWYRPIDARWIKQLGGAAHVKAKYSTEELFKMLNPSEEEREMIILTTYILFFKDYRDDVRRTHVYKWCFLWEELSRHFNVDVKDLSYFTIDEMREIIKKGKIDKQIIKRRKTNDVIITSEDNKTNVEAFEPVPERYQKVLSEVQKKKKSVEVKGIIAHSGKIKGYVRLVRNFHDLKRVQKGDILVANTTHPNYIPGMQKAAAFITNEGGIASHAAIVAREMKKPCIVGTKNATAVLNDRDYVEVDADKGLVRKI